MIDLMVPPWGLVDDIYLTRPPFREAPRLGARPSF